MSQEYDNTNSGALFKNDRKEKPTQPDYRGNWTDSEGRKYYISAWIKQSKSGQSFMSLSATPQDNQPAAAPAAAPTVEDIPF